MTFRLVILLNTVQPSDRTYKPSMLIEVGLDQIQLVLDADTLCRAFRFLADKTDDRMLGDLDARWLSGDWRDCVLREMWTQSSFVMDYGMFLQPIPESWLDDSYLISSERINVTARTTQLELRVPAAVHQDVRSSDIIVTVKQMTTILSSALPRSFLGGKISGPSDDMTSPKDVSFPNDPGDISYQLIT